MKKRKENFEVEGSARGLQGVVFLLVEFADQLPDRACPSLQLLFALPELLPLFRGTSSGVWVGV